MRLYPTLTTSHTIPPSIVNQLAPTMYGAMMRKGKEGGVSLEQGYSVGTNVHIDAALTNRLRLRSM